MRSAALLLLAPLCTLLSSCACHDCEGAPKPDASWKLVWSDEFDRTGRPDPAKWTYEVGFVRNEELQYYTKDRRENARVENGCLVIEGRKESFPNPAYKKDATQWQKARKKADYTSASLTTEGKFAWQYGRIEVRAKLPGGKGTWPAIWMLGANKKQVGYPRCGEIDIMEFLGKEPRNIYGTMHFPSPANGERTSDGGRYTHPANLDGFHTYAIEWDADKIVVFFDSKAYHTFQVSKAGEGDENPFRKPQYLILNLALGGGWGGEMDDSVLPQRYLVDYVRVYQKQRK